MRSAQLSLITLLATTAVLSHAAPAAASTEPTTPEARIAAIRNGPWGPLLENGSVEAEGDTTLARAWGNGRGRAWGNGGRRYYGGRAWGNGGRRYYGGGAWGNGGGRGFVNW
ncbi:MAG: GrrA/OscA1 family cyclophane-containing rSAM-modified RiPP [Synechococcaceae cyanobacterium]